MKMSNSRGNFSRRFDLEYWLTEVMDKIMWPAAIVLFLMALLTTVDVIGRYIFLKPILGNNEYQQLMMVIVVFLAMGYCTIKARHANADVVIVHLSKRTQAILGIITWSLSAMIYGLISWQVTGWGWSEILSPTRFTYLLSINEAPFILVAAFGCFTIFLGSLVNLFRDISRIRSNEVER